MSTEQSMLPLAVANRTRLARSAVKRSVASGEMTISEALEDPSCRTMAVFDLLIAQRCWGRCRTVNVLSRLTIGEQRHVGELTVRQRSLLVRACEPDRVAA